LLIKFNFLFPKYRANIRQEFCHAGLYQVRPIEYFSPFFLVAQAFQPVQAQAKACGYIFPALVKPAGQNPCRTLLGSSQIWKNTPL
jgi:hypothetical protein